MCISFKHDEISIHKKEKAHVVKICYTHSTSWLIVILKILTMKKEKVAAEIF